MRATTAAAVSLLCALVVVPWAGAGVDASRAVASYVTTERYLFDLRNDAYLWTTHDPTALAHAEAIEFAFPGSEDLLVQASFVRLYAELATFTGTPGAA